MIKNFLGQLMIVYVIVLSIICLGCPKANVEQTKAASKKVAIYANESVEITRTLFQNKLITLDQKDKLADALINLARGGQAFDAAVAKLESSDSKPNLQTVLSVFRTDIVNRFIAVLEKLKLVNISQELKQTIAAIQTSVLLIADILGAKVETKRAIEGV